jgi:hypothetical protein
MAYHFIPFQFDPLVPLHRAPLSYIATAGASMGASWDDTKPAQNIKCPLLDYP